MAGGSVIDPADADDFFARQLEDVRGGPLDAGQVMARLGSVCQAYRQKSAMRSQEAGWLEQARLWELLAVLGDGEGAGQPCRPPAAGSPQARLEAFLQSDPGALRLVRTKAWLETGVTRAWVPAEKRSAAVPLMSVGRLPSLDPDSVAAAHRAGLLDPQDVEFEAAQLRTLYELVRRGRVQEAILWCLETGQGWRAAIIGGGLAFSDPVLDGAGEDAPPAVSGNPNRREWQAALGRMLRSPHVPLDPYERALYAGLVGDVAGLLPVCQDWRDLLWAALNGLLNRLVDGVLCAGLPVVRVEEALAELEAIPKMASDDPVYLLVRALLLGHGLGEALFAAVQREPSWALFAGAAAVLLPGSIGPDYGDVLIHTYLRQLAQHPRHFQLYPFYCSRMRSEAFRNDTLVSFWMGPAFAGQSDGALRRAQLALARHWGFSLPALLRRLVEAKLPSDAGDLADWLLFEDPGLLPLRCESLALLTRRALLARDLRQARRLLATPGLPADGPLASVGLADNPSIGHFIRELSAYRVLVHTWDLYEHWAQAYAASAAQEKAAATPEAFSHMALDLLASGWLLNVDADATDALGPGQRSCELARLRAMYLTEMALLVASAAGLAGPWKDEIAGRLARVLEADPALLGWLREEGLLGQVADRLRALCPDSAFLQSL